MSYHGHGGAGPYFVSQNSGRLDFSRTEMKMLRLRTHFAIKSVASPQAIRDNATVTTSPLKYYLSYLAGFLPSGPLFTDAISFHL